MKLVLPAFLYNCSETILADNLQVFRKTFKEKLSKQLQGKVLDVCCGIGNLSDLVTGSYTGIDLDEDRIEHASRHYKNESTKKFHVMDVCKAEFEKASFDLVFFVNAMHHLSDSESLGILRKIAEFAKEDIVIMEPVTETERIMSRVLLTLDRGDFLRSKSDQEDLIVRAGLEIVGVIEDYARFACCRVFYCRPAKKRSLSI